MLEELRRYKKTGQMSERLGEMFLAIARRFTARSCFYGYSYRDDMVSEAVYRMVTQVDKFDPDHPSGNPFAYFTQIAYHQVLNVLKKEKKQVAIKDMTRERVWRQMSEEEGIPFVEFETGDDCFNPEEQDSSKKDSDKEE